MTTMEEEYQNHLLRIWSEGVREPNDQRHTHASNENTSVALTKTSQSRRNPMSAPPTRIPAVQQIEIIQRQTFLTVNYDKMSFLPFAVLVLDLFPRKKNAYLMFRNRQEHYPTIYKWLRVIKSGQHTAPAVEYGGKISSSFCA